MTIATHTRRAADRAQYLLHENAALTMRNDARHWRELALDITAARETHGPDHIDYQAGVIARLEIVAAWCDHMADKNKAYADQYFALCGAE